MAPRKSTHQVELLNMGVDVTEHGNLLGGQLRGEHPCACAPHASHPPHAAARGRHLLEHGARHLHTHTGTQALRKTPLDDLGRELQSTSLLSRRRDVQS